MNRVALIGLIGVFLVVYLLVGIPWLNDLTATSGVLVSFPILIVFYVIFAYLAGAIVGRGPKALVLFVTGFIAADVFLPPILVSSTGQIPTIASQQLASDVFFFKLFTSQGIGVTAAYWLTYVAVPLAAISIFVWELKTSRLSKILPKIL